MKLLKLLLSLTFLAAFMLTNQSEAKAQDCQKWGPDSVKSVQEISLYREFYKQNNYADAIKHWRYVFANAQGARQQTYVDGAKMYEQFIRDNAKDKELYLKYADTVIMIYDQRMQCFGNRESVLPRKAYTMCRYNKGTLEEQMAILDEVMQLNGNEMEYYLLNSYMSTAVEMEKAGKLKKEDVFARYQKAANVIDFNTNPANKSKYADKYEGERSNIEVHLRSIVTNCDDAKGVFTKRYAETPDDTTLQQNIYSLLLSVKCTDDPLFIEVTTKLAEQKKDARMFYFLARKAESNQAALELYQKAIDHEPNDSTKAEYYLEAAAQYRTMGDYGSARSYAQKAIDVRSGWCEPYLLIGDLYASSGKKCGPGTGFASQVVTWVAIDMYNQAKSVDPSCADKANKKIGQYAQYMPTKEDIFFQGLAVGGSYTVECWIQRSTTIRARVE